jgi:hypothetical protein
LFYFFRPVAVVSLYQQAIKKSVRLRKLIRIR